MNEALPGFDGGPAQLRGTLDSLLEGVQVLDPEWRYLYVNQAVAAHGRKGPDELLGRTMLECYPGIERTTVFHELERCMRERSASQLENEFEHEDGERSWFELRIRPCNEGLIVLSLDITERKRLEEALRQTQNLRALGQFAAGVAHDLRNFLTPVEIEVSMLELQLSAKNGVADSLDTLRSAVLRAKEMIKVLQDFARQSPEAELPESVALNEIVRQARRLGASHDSRISVEESLTATSRVRVKPPELLSALLNLIANAVDAMPEGGRLTLSTGSSDAEAWVEVGDSGIGMEPEIRQRALEPFFSTKGEGSAGLGLAMVYAFAARNNGTLQVQSEVGIGTRVRISFPVNATRKRLQRTAPVSRSDIRS